MSHEPRERSAARIPERWVWIDGELKHGADATLSVFDRGARDGEGLFETLRLYQGQPFQWSRHLERLVVSAAELGFPVPPSPRALRAGLERLVEQSGASDAVARITVTRGIPSGGAGRRTRTSSWIEVEPLAARKWHAAGGAVRLICSRQPFEPGPLGRHKTTSRLAYHLAREEARAARAQETLLFNSSGWLLEGAVSNVFVVEGGAVYTPPLALGILPGIARATVLRLCARLELAAEERRLTAHDLAAADEVFVTNSVQEVAVADAVDGRALGAPAVGTRLAQAYAAEVARELHERGGVAPRPEA